MSTSVLRLPDLLAALRADVHPPLYYLLLHLWFTVAPANELSLRVFSALGLGLAGWFFWRFLAEAEEPGIAWTGAALLLANPLLLLMAGYGRMYTLETAVCAASLWCSWRLLNGPKASRSAGLALMLATTAGLLTHNWFVFFLLGLGVTMLARFGSSAFRLAVPVVGGGFLYMALWGDAALAQIGSTGEQLAWLKRPGWTAGLEVLAAHLWLLAAVAPVLLIIVALRGARPRPTGAWWQPALGALICILVPWVISQWKPLYNSRFTVVAAPFLAWALAGFVWRAGTATIPVLTVAACLWATFDARNVSPCNSRSAAEILAQRVQPTDTVVYCRLSRQPIEWYWGRGPGSRTSFPASIDQHPGYEGTPRTPELEAEAARLLAGAPGRIVAVVDSASPASQVLLRALERDFRPEEPACAACESAGKHYFNRIQVFERRP
ncbi:MAG: glycosyltransferase family 39 protein [Acidobacteria bacterium]|nr:glycosyltransferase family 39 protein [Acidobacteriota bacterium]